MNILYYSVHHILEYDELLMFRSLGHHVFRLGTRDRTTSTAHWRPEIPNTDREDQLHSIYASMGGRYHHGTTLDEVLPPGFIAHFSVVVVMHSIDFIAAHWHKISHRPVIWRTIGQDIERFEILARPYRQQGLKVVRYSQSEKLAPNSVGSDAIIRFCKRPEDYGGWIGREKRVLTFCNTYGQRYPNEARDFSEVAASLPCVLGGYGNETLPQSVGIVTDEEQKALYSLSSAYLYASAMDVPYTLNFMEAWMTGTPMVVYAPADRRGAYYEIDALVEDGENAFVCRTVDEVIASSQRLLADDDCARRMSDKGRAGAIAHFGQQRIAAQWDALLSAFD